MTINSYWKPIPGYSTYEASEQGEIRNVKTNVILKTWAKSNIKPRRKVEVKDNNNNRKSVSVARLVCAAKEGRWPNDYEHTCHIDGNCTNDAMSNLRFSDVVNNAIDEIECGRLTTEIKYIDFAIERLLKLKESYTTD